MLDVKGFIKNFFKQKSEQNQIYKEPEPIDGRYNDFEHIKVGNLIDDGKTYWKFTQSQIGLSHEFLYAEYKIGEIETAADDVELLSFVESSNIGKCIGYGDRLTKFKFDKDELCASIKDNDVIIKGNAFGEMTTKELIPEAHYSLKDISTINLIIQMSSTQSLVSMFHGFTPIDKALEEYGFFDSLQYINYIKENIHLDSFDDFTKLKENIEIIREKFEIITFGSKAEDISHSDDKSVDYVKLQQYERHNDER